MHEQVGQHPLIRLRLAAAPRQLLTAALATALLFAPAAFAQQAPAGDRIEQQMTPEQFRAAGLDQLSPAQLDSLNAWLNRTLEAATTTAAETAKTQVQEESRGFLSFGSSEPIRSTLAGEFRGFGRGRSYTLENGHVWEQVDGATLAGVRKTDPAVTITPARIGNVWYMSIEGYNTRAKVQRIK